MSLLFSPSALMTLEAVGTSCCPAPSSSRSPCSCPEAGRTIVWSFPGRVLFNGSVLALTYEQLSLFKHYLEQSQREIKKLILDFKKEPTLIYSISKKFVSLLISLLLSREVDRSECCVQSG